MTNQIIHYIYSITQDYLSPEVYQQARKCLIDYLAVTIPGAMALSDKTLNYIHFLQSDIGESTIVGLNSKTNMQTAAASTQSRG